METLTPAPQQTAEEKPKFEIEKLREFVKLENEVKDYKAKIKANEAAMDALELEITIGYFNNGHVILIRNIMEGKRGGM